MDATEPESSDQGDHVVSDTGPFALIPEWVIDAKVSDRALRLYAVLARYADQRGHAWPRRSVLADRLRTSVKSLDRAMAELEATKAVEIRARHDEGGQRSNLYILRRICPHPSSLVSPPPGQDSRPPRDTGVPQNENQLNENQGTKKAGDVVALDAPGSRPDVDRLCGLLAELIEANGSKRPTITKAWRSACRLMIDKDGREPERMERLIHWVQGDEFWRANILSMPKLREKYDQVRLQANRAVKRTPGGNVAKVQSDMDEYLRRRSG